MTEMTDMSWTCSPANDNTVEWLRSQGSEPLLFAADEIEELRAEVEQLRDATLRLPLAIITKALEVAADTRLADLCNAQGWTTTEAGEFLGVLRGEFAVEP